MQTLTFITHDITPEHWADFIRTGGLNESNGDKPIAPYILIHSPTQQDLTATPHINAPIQTHFRSATFQDLKSCHAELYATDPKYIQPCVFLILDQASTSDRCVVVMAKGREWRNPDGTEADSADGPDVTKYTVWRKYRAPFEQAWVVQCGIEGFGGMETAEEYFVEIVEREVYVESSEEEEEEEDSDETTSEDLEYRDFPIKAKQLG